MPLRSLFGNSGPNGPPIPQTPPKQLKNSCTGFTLSSSQQSHTLLPTSKRCAIQQCIHGVLGPKRVAGSLQCTSDPRSAPLGNSKRRIPFTQLCGGKAVWSSTTHHSYGVSEDKCHSQLCHPYLETCTGPYQCASVHPVGVILQNPCNPSMVRRCQCAWALEPPWTHKEYVLCSACTRQIVLFNSLSPKSGIEDSLV